MFDVIRIKKHIKLMIQEIFDWNDNLISPSKTAPIFSQQNIYELNLLNDGCISKFFLKITFNYVFLLYFIILLKF